VAEASVRRRLLVISNGHGEDWIAAAIAARLPASMSVEAYPMIGAGTAYHGICPIVGPRARLDSGGARTAKGSLRRDVSQGGLAMIPPVYRFLRSVRGQYDKVLVVGDVIGVLFACYKTGAARLYSGAERWVIARACKQVFCRADNLAALLANAGVEASSPGNLMMDTIPHGDYNAALRRTRPLGMTLLPGSRGKTAENFARQVAGLRKVDPMALPDLFLAVAGDVEVETLASAAKLSRTPLLSADSDDLGTLSDGTITINMLRGRAMGNALMQSDLVMSQAGTATVQALGLGRPVITMTNPQDRQSRFMDEQALFGEARLAVPDEPDRIALALNQLLASPDERRRLGDIGRQRIGGPGAIHAVLDALVS
jgi:hypothetical protein